MKFWHRLVAGFIFCFTCVIVFDMWWGHPEAFSTEWVIRLIAVIILDIIFLTILGNLVNRWKGK